jgi:hypothetical protein
LDLFVRWPLLALLPGLLLLGVYRVFPRRAALVAGLAWLVYAIYELGMQKRWLCFGECNIRVDLLLMFPVLAVISIAGIVAAARAAKST